MRRRLFFSLVACAVALAAAALVPARSPAQSVVMSTGDTTLAAGAAIKLYPCFSLGGGHIHAPQFYAAENGCGFARRGYLFTSIADVRVNVYGGASSDTSGFTIPGGASFGSLPECDSVSVLSTSTQSTRLTWGFFR